MEFTVLMSVYHREKPDYLRKAIESVLSSTILPKELLVIEDGPLTEELYSVLNYFGKTKIVRRVPLEKNKGLAEALNVGILNASTELIARMDTDDICKENRFELQLKFFEKNLNLIMVGSNVDEFTKNETNIIGTKKMPKTPKEIKKYFPYRNPFNHPTVMYNKKYIVSVGMYDEVPLFEDYFLWLKLVSRYGVDNLINIDKSLVSMRVVDDLYRRRGGISYAKKSFNFRKRAIIEKKVNFFPGIVALIATSLIALVPNYFRKMIYRNYLRIKN